MKQGLLFVIVLCSFAAALVPRHRRTVDSETTTPKREICAPQTPCGWSVYSEVTKLVEVNITNSYCVCSKDKSCVFGEDDLVAKAYVYRCK